LFVAFSNRKADHTFPGNALGLRLAFRGLGDATSGAEQGRFGAAERRFGVRFVALAWIIALIAVVLFTSFSAR
jgi:hypothetical protein